MLCIVTAVECFIKEIGFKMAQHAKENGLYVLTPVELYVFICTVSIGRSLL
jgi:hypothetical protein